MRTNENILNSTNKKTFFSMDFSTVWIKCFGEFDFIKGSDLF